MDKVVPLSSGFMLTSIIGFLVAVFFVWKMSETWGFLFALFFVIMFIASVINMSQLEAADRYDLGELAIHEKGHYQRRKGQK
jgi:hypothetical protein